jgi:Flp pilus assembly protein TadG
VKRVAIDNEPRNVRPANRRRVRASARRGLAAVEAAFVLPLLVMLMMGVWEVGRMVEVSQILNNAVREGARYAAGGTSNNIPVTVALVQSQVQNYMTSAGLPSAAVSGSTVTVTNQSANTWTDPCDASPLDQFQVSVTIPSGSAFDSLKWGLTKSITGMTSLTVSTKWYSANDSKLTVSSTLPY